VGGRDEFGAAEETGGGEGFAAGDVVAGDGGEEGGVGGVG